MDMGEEVTLDVQGYLNTWDSWLDDGSGGEGFHLENRELLDNEASAGVGHQQRLRTFDVDNIDVHDALDASHHQHLDDIIDEERQSRKKRTTESERRPSKPSITTPWSLRYNYIFLFLWNTFMLFLYYTSDFLREVPTTVQSIIVLLHISAICLYSIDATTHMLRERGCCIPGQVHSV